MKEFQSSSYKKHSSRSFNFKDIPELLKDTYRNWMDSNPFQLSAIVAYYAILSLPALIVIILNVVGSIWGKEIVQGELLDEISKAIGQETAESIRLMMLDRGDKKTGLFTTIVGVIVLIYGATGVFFQLQNALNKIWGMSAGAQEGVINLIKSRAKGFGFILILGFLLLVSLLMTTLISTFSNRLAYLLPEVAVDKVFIGDTMLSLILIYTLFAALFKFLPDVNIRWRAVRVGAAITAVLFVVGKFLLAYYFKIMEPGSTYGAAGSIILIMLWVSYSSLILFFGANFTKVYANKYLLQKQEIKRGVGSKNKKSFASS
ncbi:YihY/virulence factor BrkB family protein [Dokdonia sp. Hel_I_53]|uniref:YihY/virulence factor BrkB family protein n=1 Tax=Dokdonia sp. Hel_I_53 TaxID=1566287 RepID=UPI0011998696|nr:YihY/virulence factor BrkB family protein [Dokdonia sp. Hel_I_53]TVZ51429.1 membrane protein [Dokdonia sp. Hel_I_53]